MWKRILTAQRPFLYTKLVFVPSSSMVFSSIEWTDTQQKGKKQFLLLLPAKFLLSFFSGDFGFPQRKQQRYTGHIGAPKSVILGPSVLDPGSLHTRKEKKKKSLFSHSWPSDLPSLWNDSAGKIQVPPPSVSPSRKPSSWFSFYSTNKRCALLFYFFSHRYA